MLQSFAIFAFFAFFAFFAIAAGRVSGLAMPFALNVKVSVKPEFRGAWLAAIQDDQICTRRDEPGNLQFIVGEDTSMCNLFYLHEEFKDERAFQAHTQTPHFARYMEFCNEHKPFTDEMELLTYSILEEDASYSKNKRPVVYPAFCLNVNLYPKPEVREAFLKVISNNKKGTDSTEPLARQYTYGESTTMANTFHFHEQYVGNNSGKGGFDAHASTPHFAAWEDFVSTDPFVKPPEVFFFRAIEPEDT